VSFVFRYRMTAALIYPPLCDPTAPYLSVPLLAACLRRAGIDVLSIDANADAVAWLLQGSVMAGFARRVRARFAQLDARSSLGLADQLDLVQIYEALGPAGWVPGAVDGATATLRDPVRFFDPSSYATAVATVEAALQVVSAACAPLRIDFASWSSPFSLLNPNEISDDASPQRDPFHAWYAGPLAARLREARPSVVGVSVAFPGQVQPAFAMARAIRKALPETHLVVGGPAISQILLRIPEDRIPGVLGPFDSAVVGEGERALVDLVKAVKAGTAPRGIVHGGGDQDLADLPPPDFSTMVPGAYLSPSMVLPYDAARGCYWGKCAFCHYGPVRSGTARYRERPAATVADHLGALARLHGTSIFYLSEDTLSPKGALAVARALSACGGGLRWATDIRPEIALSPAVCASLVSGGLLAVSIGVESADPGILARIDKGIRVEDVDAAVMALSSAGVAVEAMAFTGFPGETTAEALRTIRWLKKRRDSLSLFICGEFALTHGSRVAGDPSAFGLAETWEIAGDELRSGLFWRGMKPGPGPKVDAAVEELSEGWNLGSYPWAGSLSTAHTLLWYARFGSSVFKDIRMRGKESLPRQARRVRTRYDVASIARWAPVADQEIWDILVNDRRDVSRAAWEAMAARFPPAVPGALKP
jgi:hypothetical protein